MSSPASIPSGASTPEPENVDTVQAGGSDGNAVEEKGKGVAADQNDVDGEQPVASSSTSPAPTAAPAATAAVATNGDWQAIWSPQHNAYYFFNAVTQQTTWENPLQPSSAAASSSATPDKSASPGPSTAPESDTPAALAKMYALQQAAAEQGIDPALAYLDPSLASSSSGGSGYTARFNARTGAFTAADGRDPSHLSEYERMKRMSSVYFDFGEWEKEVAERKKREAEELEATGGKRKRPSKKDLERFKEQKKQKKIAKTAWLRN
ncbi:unnamed protein product [Peniophora sp. CBMAI 1063]|nr:unnamed protein product [Peniophora sp. CBMAI 1063]